MYDYSSLSGTTNVSSTTGGILGVLGAASLVVSILSFAIGILMIVSMARIFQKAGKPWWAAIVPIYNIIVMLQIAELPIWYLILFIIPIANIYAMYKVYAGICKMYGKGTGFAILTMFFPFICFPILAFSKGNVVAAEPVEAAPSEPMNNDMFAMNNQSVEQPTMTTTDFMQSEQPAMTTTDFMQPEQPTMTTTDFVQPEPVMQQNSGEFKECPNCHTKVKSDAPLCFICGNKLS